MIEEPQVNINHVEPNYDLNLAWKTQTDMFFLDFGITIHIFPNMSDFIALKPIYKQPIWGVGGSCIAAAGLAQSNYK